MADYWIWWIAAALLVGLELATGTFYLLAVGVAFVLGGVAAWLGASVPMQLTVGGTLAVIAVIAAHQWRKRRATPAPLLPLEFGQAVRVDRWNPDGTARVVYRGTQWDAELAGPDTYRAETMYIVATRGSTLVLSDRRP
jgi:membrane protein implicated in regulation of membrane protease activity